MFTATHDTKYAQIAAGDDETHPITTFVQRWRIPLVASHVIVSLMALAIGLLAGHYLLPLSTDGVGMSQLGPESDKPPEQF
jgi:hypothetical protein